MAGLDREEAAQLWEMLGRLKASVRLEDRSAVAHVASDEQGK